MIEIVINYDQARKEFKAYEPSTDTLFITGSLGETFLKLDEFLKQRGLLVMDILAASDITYHIDSATFMALIENNVALLKRLNQAPSGFQISSQRFGAPSPSQSTYQAQAKKQGQYSGNKKKYPGSTGTFSKSTFNNSAKKFGGNKW